MEEAYSIIVPSYLILLSLMKRNIMTTLLLDKRWELLDDIDIVLYLNVSNEPIGEELVDSMAT